MAQRKENSGLRGARRRLWVLGFGVWLRGEREVLDGAARRGKVLGSGCTA